MHAFFLVHITKWSKINNIVHLNTYLFNKLCDNVWKECLIHGIIDIPYIEMPCIEYFDMTNCTQVHVILILVSVNSSK